jgi:hypothetical protein
VEPSTPNLGVFDVYKMQEARDVDGLMRVLGTPTTPDEAAKGDAAARALAKLRDPRAREPLLAILELTPYPITREAVISALGDIGDEHAVQPMIETFRSSAQVLRDTIASVREDPRALDPALTPGLDDMLPQAVSSMAITAAGALGKLGDTRAVAHLRAVLDDEILRESADSPQAQRLDSGTYSGNPYVRRRGYIDALPGAARRLRDTAADALARIGPAESREQIPVAVSGKENDAVYAFFVRADESAFPSVIDTSGFEKWRANIAEATETVGADVELVPQEEWEAPRLRSVSEGCSERCFEGIQRYFTDHGLPPMSRDDFARQHTGDMKSDITGLLVILVKRPAPQTPHP